MVRFYTLIVFTKENYTLNYSEGVFEMKIRRRQPYFEQKMG